LEIFSALCGEENPLGTNKEASERRDESTRIIFSQYVPEGLRGNDPKHRKNLYVTSDPDYGRMSHTIKDHILIHNKEATFVSYLNKAITTKYFHLCKEFGVPDTTEKTTMFKAIFEQFMLYANAEEDDVPNNIAAFVKIKAEESAAAETESAEQSSMIESALNRQTSVILESLSVLMRAINSLALNVTSCEAEEYKSYDGGRYEGHLLGGKRHGQGVYSWPDGSSHTGEWTNDAPNGYGVRIYSNGDKYEGSWLDNKRKGFGAYTWKDGAVYVGDWDGECNGTGKRTSADGTTLDGQWRDGSFILGKAIYPDGVIYDGKWIEEGMWKGQFSGTVTFSSGKSYDIAYSKNRYKFINDDDSWTEITQLSSDGDLIKIVWSAGSMYEGDAAWIEEDYAQGKYLDCDGSLYDGEWSGGKQNGEGTKSWPGGIVYSGGWRDDKRCGHGIITSPEGFSYDGEWENDRPHGHGTAVYPDGLSYSGQWENGKYSGKGVLKKASGEVTDGIWANGKLSEED
jgi:hypothetical protein